jgi:hygromycin-B 7''-O-kinase
MQQLPTHDQFLKRFYDPVWLEIGHALFAREGLSVGRIIRSEQGESVVLVGDNRYVLKIYRPWKRGFERESSALEKLSGKLHVPIPDVVSTGELEGYGYLITTAIAGRTITRPEWLGLNRKTQLDLICQLADFFRELHALPVDGIESDWPGFVARNAAGAVDRQRLEGGNPEWIESLPAFIELNLQLVRIDKPNRFLHGDIHFGNLRFLGESGRLRISGVFDFADSLIGSQEYDFIAPGVLMIPGQGDLQREFFRRYGYLDADINEEMRRRMMMLTILYEYSSLRRYAERLSPGAIELSLTQLERAMWNFA